MSQKPAATRHQDAREGEAGIPNGADEGAGGSEGR